MLKGVTSLILVLALGFDSAHSLLRATNALTVQSNYTLSDNNTIPVLGLGVYLSEPGNETHDAVTWALQAGYRLVDTAALYDNEEDVGDAIFDHHEVHNETSTFITTKLMPDDHGFNEALDACEDSIEKLGVSHIDLYLIHSPDGEKLIETYDALLFLQKDDIIKSVGVSNFGIQHLEAIAADGRPRPAVNQIEMHPLIYQKRKDLVEYCKKNNILIQAYGSMLAGKQEWLEKPLVKDMAKKYKRTVPQVLLRWAIQHGFQVIPKSVKKERIESNIQVFDFELSDADMTTLDNWSGDLDEYGGSIDEVEVDLGETNNWPDFTEMEEVPDEELEFDSEDEDMEGFEGDEEDMEGDEEDMEGDEEDEEFGGEEEHEDEAGEEDEDEEEEEEL